MDFKPQDNVGVTFVNTVVTRGIMHNVINLSFGVFNFTPNEQGEVELDPTVACRLRMDRVCAMQLRDTLNHLFESIEQTEAAASNSATIETGGIAPRKEEVN